MYTLLGDTGPLDLDSYFVWGEGDPSKDSYAMFDFKKVLRKEKNAKKNNFSYI